MVMDAKNIEEMLNYYRTVLKIELGWGVKLPELRHLNGRIGELYTAKETNGTMATEVNQHGYDVISGVGERISVKTTSTISGKHLFTFNKNTIDQVDRVVLLRINEEAELKVLLDEPLEKAKLLMNERGRKLIIRQGKLNNLSKYLSKSKIDYNTPNYSREILSKMDRYDFDLNGNQYELFMMNGVVRLVKNQLPLAKIKPQLKLISDQLGLSYGKNTINKTLAKRIIEKLDLNDSKL